MSSDSGDFAFGMGRGWSGRRYWVVGLRWALAPDPKLIRVWYAWVGCLLDEVLDYSGGNVGIELRRIVDVGGLQRFLMIFIPSFNLQLCRYLAMLTMDQ